MPTLALVLVLVLVLLLAAACTDDAEKARRTPAGTTTPSASVPPSPRTEPSVAAERLPPATSPYSLPALMAEEFSSERPRRIRTVVENEAYTEHEVRYRSGDVRASGVLLVPRGTGPFPAVVLNHGYIEPSSYVSGQGLSREQEHLARAGFVVLHTDYRGHAGSDPASDLDRETRLGYTRDAINAVHALRKEPSVDPDRIAMLGRSMGGGVTMNALVAQPGLVKAAVIYASVSSDYLENLRRWTLPERPESAQRLFRRFGTPRDRPRFYDGLSARTYFDRITVPVLAHHGTLDESCPLPWARTTQRLMAEAGVDSTLRLYPGEHHAFGPQWLDSMRLTVRFLRRELSA
ncbi:alpha/beta hydrolase family protein [Nocardioides houyundeii]|uniref:alpha/beta hydrolase family protein n=1 Tax=Nocardioides houyundeii TaxID=2045452 RepID=UPI000DF2B906|nr:alpha/beta fold hydrolase [Nocardioides houyundeii]